MCSLNVTRSKYIRSDVDDDLGCGVGEGEGRGMRGGAATGIAKRKLLVKAAKDHYLSLHWEDASRP